MEAKPYINKHQKTITIELAKKGMEEYQRPVLPVVRGAGRISVLREAVVESDDEIHFPDVPQRTID